MKSITNGGSFETHQMQKHSIKIFEMRPPTLIFYRSLISWHFQRSVDKILYFGYIKGFYVELVRFNDVRWSDK